MKVLKTEIQDLFNVEISAKEWSKKHNLKIEKKACKECGKEGFLDIPCISNGYVGFYKDGCECGSDMMSFNFKPASEEKKRFWISIEQKMKKKSLQTYLC